MTNISVKNRQRLAEFYTIGRKSPVTNERSADGTIKYMFAVENGP